MYTHGYNYITNPFLEVVPLHDLYLLRTNQFLPTTTPTQLAQLSPFSLETPREDEAKAPFPFPFPFLYFSQRQKLRKS